MTKYLKILFIVLVMGLISCLKACIEDENDLISQDCENQCATINGFISTGDGTASISNAETEVIWKNTVYLGGGIIRTKANTTTDNNGYYELSFRVREDELEEGYYIIKIYTNEQYLHCANNEEYHDFAISELKNDTIISFNYGIPYKAQLKVKSTGATEMADNDYFSVTTTSPVGIDFEAGCGNVVSWSNAEPDKEYLLDVAANQPVIVKVGIRKGDQRFKTSDTLYLEKGEQVEYIAEFK